MTTIVTERGVTTVVTEVESGRTIVSQSAGVTTVVSRSSQPGQPGAGVPSGGTTGQVLGKRSDADLDTGWVDETGGGSGAVASVNTQTGDVVLDAADVGADVAGTAAAALATAESYTDAETARAEAAEGALSTALSGKAAASALTAEVTRATTAEGANAAAITAEATARSNADAAEVIARNAAIATAVAGVLGGAPGALDTLKELAGAINDDASFAATITTALAGKQPLDADLTAIAALSTTAFGRAFLTMADAAATKTALALVKGDVGLGNVDNTSDANKPVSTAQAAADALSLAKASNLSDVANAATARTNLGVPAGSGTSTGTNTGDQALPTALPPNGAAGGDLTGTYPNPTLATARALASRQVIAGTGLTGGGDLTADRTLTVAYGTSGSTAAVGNDSRLSDARTPTTHAASHASGGSDAVTLAESQVTNLTTDLAAKAPLASPTFTGNPAAPTQAAGDNSTKLATTAFVAAVATRTLHLPSGALSATFDRGPASTAAQAILTSGTLWMVGLDLTAGQVITSVSFRTGATGATAPTHQFFGLADSTRAVQRWTSDDTTTAWGATTTKTLNLTSTYTVPTTGFYYLLMLVTASVMPQPVCVTANTNINAIAPITNGPTTDTGLTTPPALPFTAGAVTATANTPYGWVS